LITTRGFLKTFLEESLVVISYASRLSALFHEKVGRRRGDFVLEKVGFFPPLFLNKNSSPLLTV